MLRYPPSRRLLIVLGSLLAAAVLVSGWGAHYPRDWILENALVAAFVTYLALTWKRLPLSAGSCVLIFVFLCFHEVGATGRMPKFPTTRGPRTGSAARSTPCSASSATTSTG